MVIMLFVLATVLVVFGLVMLVASWWQRRADRLASSVLADKLIGVLRSLRYSVVIPSSTGALGVMACHYRDMPAAVLGLGELVGVGIATSTRQTGPGTWAVVASRRAGRVIGWSRSAQEYGWRVSSVPAVAACLTVRGVWSHACSCHAAAVATVAARAQIPISDIEVRQVSPLDTAILADVDEGILGWVVCHEPGADESVIISMISGES